MLVLSEFVYGLAQFAIREDREKKLQFLFRIYDMDRDGYISNGELFQVENLTNHMFTQPSILYCRQL